MRGKIKIDTRKNVLNKDGYPIVFYLTKDSKEKTIRTGYRSKKEHWNAANALPTKKHPEFIAIINYLDKKKIILARIIERSKLEPVNFKDAEWELNQQDSDVFYSMGLTVNGSRTYKIALNSFNKYFPKYTFSEITKKVVRDYMEILLTIPVNGKPRSPNGVISYLNTLTAIWNKLDKQNNPFSGIRPKAMKTKNKALSDEDMLKVINHKLNPHYNSNGGGTYNYLNYFLLCFYLGGMDLGDLVKMRYDKNVVDGRLEFRRSKGGTNVFVSNIITSQAKYILSQYDCKPYLIPLSQSNNYKNFIPNMSRVLPSIQSKLGLSKLPYSKAPRYTFITRAQNLLIDERLVVEIVGHSETSTHSIYKDAFPKHIRDKAHIQIIEFL